MTNINRVTITGNLTRDPEIRTPKDGTSLCTLRVACSSRTKGESGWENRPNYFDVTVWGAQGTNAARYLAKGRPVAIDGRLEWHEWTKDGTRRQAVGIVADVVQFLGAPPAKDDADARAQAGQSSAPPTATAAPAPDPTPTPDTIVAGSGF